ncbi:MAG: hypothetical protein ACLQA5_04440 [Solirubrobacteraceae bacterium]
MALVTLVASGALAACGSSSSGSTTSSTTAAASSSGSSSGSASGTAGSGAGSARRAQLVSCLKSHGVTLPARPAGAGAPPGAGGGSGSGTGTGTGTTPRRGFFFGGGGARNISPKMQAAFKACGANFGFGAGGGGAFRGRISHTAITSFVACVNQHGYHLPAPNFSGKGPIFSRSIETNAKFQAAAKSCEHLLIPARPSGGSSGGTSTTSGA